MSVRGTPGGFWQSVRRLPDRTPLRIKMITAVLTLVIIALAVISIAGISVLRSYLLDQADGNLQVIARSAQTNYVEPYLITGQTAYAPGTAVDWVPHGGKVHAVVTPGFGMGRDEVRLTPGPAVSATAGWVKAATGEPRTVATTSGDGRWRVLAFERPFADPSGDVFTGTIIVGQDVSTVYATIGRLTAIDLLVSAIVIVGLAVVGIAVVRASLRPLSDIEQTAEAIAAGDLARRVPDLDPRTEVGRLGRALNVMLSQIETAFRAQAKSEAAARRSEERMRQFVADASHELRTPLTAIRGFAEYYRQRGGVAEAGPAPARGNGSGGASQLAPEDLDRIMRRVEQESSRMGVLVEDMLLLARLDQQRPLDRHTVDLLTLAADAVHDARVVAPSRSIHLTVGAGAALLVLGDEVRLRQVIGNLMSNALAHTPDGTPIDVRIRSGSLDEARSSGVAAPPVPPAALLAPAPPPPGPPPAPGAGGPRSAAVLEVIDHGPGLTREQAEHAFERFYRADQSRTTGGTGLGLAIVAALVTAHGGTVWVESMPGAGATFRIALPLAPEALHADDDHADDHSDANPGDVVTGGMEPGDAPAHPAGQHDTAGPGPGARPRDGTGPGPGPAAGAGPASRGADLAGGDTGLAGGDTGLAGGFTRW